MEKGSYHQPLCYPTADRWWLQHPAALHKTLHHKCGSLRIAGSCCRPAQLPQTPMHAVTRPSLHLTWHRKLSVKFNIPEYSGSRTIYCSPLNILYDFCANCTIKKKAGYCYYWIVSSQDFCVSKRVKWTLETSLMLFYTNIPRKVVLLYMT